MIGVALWLAQLLRVMNGDLVRDRLVQLAVLCVDDSVCHLHTGRLEVGLALRLAVETKNTGWGWSKRDTNEREKERGAVRKENTLRRSVTHTTDTRAPAHVRVCASAPTGA